MRTNISYLAALLAFVMLACGDVSVEGPIGARGDDRVSVARG